VRALSLNVNEEMAMTVADMKRNLPTLSDLSEIEPSEIAKFSAEELYVLQTILAAEQERVKKAAARLLAGLEQKFGEAAKRSRLMEGKEHGVTHLTDGVFDVAADLPKRIEWDSDALGELIVSGKLTAEQADHFIRYKYDVLESRYNGAEPKVKVLLDKARTVKPGSAKYTISRRENGK